MNPLAIVKNFLMKGNSPEQLITKFMQQNTNPFMNNLFELAKQNKTDELEKIARNMFKEQGRDFDSEFKEFKKNMGS